MKRFLIIGASTLASVLAVPLVAADLTPDEQAFFDKHTSDFVGFEVEKLDEPAMQDVFSTPFYRVNVVLKESAGEQRSEMIVARIDDRLVPVNRPGTDDDLPDFKRVLNPAFKLKTNGDAALMQLALDAAYPVVTTGDKKVKAFKRQGNRWLFVRGEFFDSKLGYLFETDASGTITSAKFLLKLP